MYLLIAYIIFMIIKLRKIPDSVSDTYYEGAGNWFTIVMFISGILMTIRLLDISQDSAWSFISFLSGAGMLFVGAAPKFKGGEKIIHFAGATTLLIGSQIWICMYACPLVLLTWLTAPLWIKRKQKMFWCEIVCLFNIFISLL